MVASIEFCILLELNKHDVFLVCGKRLTFQKEVLHGNHSAELWAIEFRLLSGSTEILDLISTAVTEVLCCHPDSSIEGQSLR